MEFQKDGTLQSSGRQNSPILGGGREKYYVRVIFGVCLSK